MLDHYILTLQPKKKILDQVWKDYDNMNTPNYFVSVCSDNQEICGSHFISKRKLKYLKPEYKKCKQICENATKMESQLNIKSKTNDYACKIYLIIFCFIVNFNVIADDCNLELSKNYPYFQKFLFRC